MDVLIIEHRWGSTEWLQTRPVYYSLDEAMGIMTELAKFARYRSDYQVRIRTHRGEVLCQAGGDDGPDPRKMMRVTVRSLASRLRRHMEQDGRELARMSA